MSVTPTAGRAPMDDDVLTFAIYDAIASRLSPPTFDQIELRLFGLSSDWLARRLVERFRRWGVFPPVERYLTRWHDARREDDRRHLEKALVDGVERGFWRRENGPRGDRFHAALTADEFTARLAAPLFDRGVQTRRRAPSVAGAPNGGADATRKETFSHR